jgi:hypothetical protein
MLVGVSSVLITALFAVAVAVAQPCVVPDDGTGTVSLPPAGCSYLSPNDVHMIINGLPPGTTVRLGPEHHFFICGQPGTNHCGVPGGSLGGEMEQFHSTITLHAQGTGTLSSYMRTIDISLDCQTHTAPRMPGQPVQSFNTLMNGMTGQLPPGDPDFDLLRVTAGNAFGMPSPGHTTLTKLPGGPNWAVDSFFDVFYRIDFVGHSPGPFAGRSGSTTATIRMTTNPPPIPTLSEWGMIFAVFALMTAATLYAARRRGMFARTAAS